MKLHLIFFIYIKEVGNCSFNDDDTDIWIVQIMSFLYMY